MLCLYVLEDFFEFYGLGFFVDLVVCVFLNGEKNVIRKMYKGFIKKFGV